MTATHQAKGARQGFHWPPGPVTALAVLLSVLVIGALQGGLAMVTNPVDPLGMSPDFLDNAPVDDYFWPGMFLLGIAVAAVVTLIGLLFPWRWDWAARIEGIVSHRWPWIGAIAIGVVLLVFEIIELFLVPFHPVMHPLLIAGSIAIVLLAITPSVRRYLSAER
jgi:hypothetical protein